MGVCLFVNNEAVLIIPFVFCYMSIRNDSLASLLLLLCHRHRKMMKTGLTPAADVLFFVALFVVPFAYSSSSLLFSRVHFLIVY